MLVREHWGDGKSQRASAADDRTLSTQVQRRAIHTERAYVASQRSVYQWTISPVRAYGVCKVNWIFVTLCPTRARMSSPRSLNRNYAASKEAIMHILRGVILQCVGPLCVAGAAE